MGKAIGQRPDGLFWLSGLRNCEINLQYAARRALVLEILFESA